MSLTRDQRIALELAGTVCVPSPSPAVGQIRIITDVAPGARVSLSELLARRAITLEVRHQTSPRLIIIRYVDLHEVAALFLPKDPCDVRPDQGTWILGPELQTECLHRILRRPGRNLGEDPFCLGMGCLYLPEFAQVLLRVEVGMTAAESVDYYPPLPGDRGRDYHRFFPVLPHERGRGVQEFCDIETKIKP